MGDDVDELDATEDDAAWERFLGQPDAMPLGPTTKIADAHGWRIVSTGSPRRPAPGSSRTFLV
jgi:hypothetical protein